ncbi:hypothetical protein CH333_02125 [candidate division WOR-3 bacterium JGI_Cruoil_03_44_89]|uniref:FlgD Ig-like domain-containing protein n=1 Tax=candidate division WOR-3 bacterium JGI_Cruoil_03_44_89 TaxID=1973748 RepID=A0A235BXP0_UNCW3|nr:MAG: hypothetical protein CH333_02125 [candidate division WOR-3 bacterium JGI_Cruoil_03_44_89]
MKIKVCLISVSFVLGICSNANADVPHIIRFTPPPYATNILKSVNLRVAFDMDMNPLTFTENSFVVYGSQTGWHPGSITYDDSTRTATFDPDFNFKEGEWVIATLTSDIEDIDGNHIKSYVWNFSIGVAGGTGVFGPDTEYNTCEGPRSVTCADFDNDGNLDLAVGHRFSDSMVVFRNPGNGIFERDSVYALLSVGDWSDCRLRSGDWDRDGDIDIVFQRDTAKLSVFPNTGNGVFGTELQYPFTETSLAHIYINDFNGDGYLDIAGSDYAKFYIFFNDGSGNFYNWTDYYLEPRIIPISGGDFDSDGDIDLVTVTMWGTDEVRVRIFINQGDGSFVEGESYLIGYDTGSQSIYCHDFDMDGDVDMVVDRARGQGETGYVLIFMNNGDGTFAEYVEYTAEDEVNYLYGNDFNGDGYIDLVESSLEIDKLVVFLNNGDGIFLSPVYYNVGHWPDGSDGGDFDSDGDIDLVVANQYTGGEGTISVLMNEDSIQPNIGTSTRLLSFGKVNVGDSVLLPLEVYNLGYDTLIADSLIIPDSIFAVDESGFILLPESTKTVTVTFSPVTNDSVEDTLTIFSDDPDSPEWIVKLRGNYKLVGIEEEERVENQEMEIECYPNPFIRTVSIKYLLEREEIFSIKIYDTAGREVRILLNKLQRSGFHTVNWDGRDKKRNRVPPGIYFCQMRAGCIVSTRKVIILR